jgi:hypothetical protein
MEFLKRYLFEKKKVLRDDLQREIMVRYDFSSITANRYIDDLIRMGFIKPNNDHLVYIELPTGPAPKREKA